MAKTKISKQKGVELLLIELEKGKTYSECLRVFKSRFVLVESTFALWWRSANSEYLKSVDEIKKELFELKKQKEVAQLEKAILTKEESLILLSKIANGDPSLIIEEEIKINDRIKAIQELNKLQGNYTQEINIKSEQPLFGDAPRILTRAEVRQLYEDLDKEY